MKTYILVLLSFIGFAAKAQCDNYIGYSKEGHLSSSKPIKFYLNEIDTSLKGFFNAYLAKTQITNGIVFYGIIDAKLGKIDKSVKVKITFHDNSSIYISQYNDEGNSIGFFSAVITDKYSLLLLRTKSIAKLQITGDQLDATTYQSEVLSALDFMFSMECLESYL